MIELISIVVGFVIWWVVGWFVIGSACKASEILYQLKEQNKILQHTNALLAYLCEQKSPNE
jgi:hypothetical protein